MQDTDLAWLAGIWDGEGSITMFAHQEKNGSTKICPTCLVVNTDIRIINKVRKLLEELGCNFVIHEYKPKNEKHKVQWRITSRNTRYIVLLLTAIQPYLVGEKKEKAEILLAYCTQRIAKMERIPSKGSTPYDEEDFKYLTKIRSSQTTRETFIKDDIVGSSAKA